MRDFQDLLFDIWWIILVTVYPSEEGLQEAVHNSIQKRDICGMTCKRGLQGVVHGTPLKGVARGTAHGNPSKSGMKGGYLSEQRI